MDRECPTSSSIVSSRPVEPSRPVRLSRSIHALKVWEHQLTRSETGFLGGWLVCRRWAFIHQREPNITKVERPTNWRQGQEVPPSYFHFALRSTPYGYPWLDRAAPFMYGLIVQVCTRSSRYYSHPVHATPPRDPFVLTSSSYSTYSLLMYIHT